MRMVSIGVDVHSQPDEDILLQSDLRTQMKAELYTGHRRQNSCLHLVVVGL